MHREAFLFAERLQREAPDPARRVHLAYALAFGRPPRDSERARAINFAARNGWPTFSRLLFNTNEFMFAD